MKVSVFSILSLLFCHIGMADLISYSARDGCTAEMAKECNRARRITEKHCTQGWLKDANDRSPGLDLFYSGGIADKLKDLDRELKKLSYQISPECPKFRNLNADDLVCRQIKGDFKYIAKLTAGCRYSKTCIDKCQLAVEKKCGPSYEKHLLFCGGSLGLQRQASLSEGRIKPTIIPAIARKAEQYKKELEALKTLPGLKKCEYIRENKYGQPDYYNMDLEIGEWTTKWNERLKER